MAYVPREHFESDERMYKVGMKGCVHGPMYLRQNLILYDVFLRGAKNEKAMVKCSCDVSHEYVFIVAPRLFSLSAELEQLSMRKQLSEVTLPMWLGYLERWLERAGTTFFVGETITICDLVIYTRMKWLRRGVSPFPSSCVRVCPRRFSLTAAAFGTTKAPTCVAWDASVRTTMSRLS